MNERPLPLTLTDSAAERVKTLMSSHAEPALGLRIAVSPKGCAGLAYSMDIAAEKGPFDEVIETKGVTVLIDPKAVMFLFGTELDYVEDMMQSTFVFRNPNEKGRCGCGESFHV